MQCPESATPNAVTHHQPIFGPQSAQATSVESCAAASGPSAQRTHRPALLRRLTAQRTCAFHGTGPPAGIRRRYRGQGGPPRQKTTGARDWHANGTAGIPAAPMWPHRHGWRVGHRATSTRHGYVAGYGMTWSCSAFASSPVSVRRIQGVRRRPGRAEPTWSCHVSGQCVIFLFRAWGAVMCRLQQWRIRLVVYGARLESVLV